MNRSSDRKCRRAPSPSEQAFLKSDPADIPDKRRIQRQGCGEARPVGSKPHRRTKMKRSIKHHFGKAKGKEQEGNRSVGEECNGGGARDRVRQAERVEPDPA